MGRVPTLRPPGEDVHYASTYGLQSAVWIPCAFRLAPVVFYTVLNCPVYTANEMLREGSGRRREFILRSGVDIAPAHRPFSFTPLLQP